MRGERWFRRLFGGRMAARWTCAWLALLIGSACESRPKAPILPSGPVYRHSQLAFRFLIPEGWVALSNAALPEGEIDKEVCVAQFRVPSTTGAMLEVLCFDPAYAPDLRKYHGEPSQGISDWALDGEATKVDVGGKTGERLTYTATMPNGVKQVKEVTCFERQGRVVSFVALATANDLPARDQLRRAVNSLVWE